MKHTEKFLRQRKFMMMLPVLVLPFVTLFFWALGGGQGTAARAMPATAGLNARLPDAQFDAQRERDLWDKFTLYEKAAHDSAAYETARENDPYFDLIAFQSNREKPAEDESKLIGTFKQRDQLMDPNEAKVNSKLQELYKELNRASSVQPVVTRTTAEPDPEVSSEIEQLERMMEELRTQQDDREDDHEMSAINAMLDKLMDIQHPERVRERMLAERNAAKPKAFEVQATRESSVSTLPVAQPGERHDSVFAVAVVNNGFYGLDDVAESVDAQSNTIPAVIHETQELVTGATVRLRLLQEITINNTIVPKDQFVFGTCTISGERLRVTINSILSGQVLLPVSLAVYDLSGMEGIYVPGAMSRDAAKEASDDAIQSVRMMSMDPSLSVQAATAGIEATKNLLSRKVKQVKVTVKAGHEVVLRNKTDQ